MLALVPLIIRGILFTVSWIFPASPKIGIISLLLRYVFGSDFVLINIYSLAGTIWELWQNGRYVELSARGVMMILVLLCFVMLAQLLGRRFGLAEA